MLGKLILLFIFVPIIELALLIKIGQYLGTLNTILLVIITGVAGATLAKLEGLRVLSLIQTDLLNSKMPTDRLIDGVLILVGGILLLTPGVITDVIGLLLIIPVTRPIFQKPLKKKFNSKINHQNPVRSQVEVIDISGKS